MSNPGLVMKFERISSCASIWRELFSNTSNQSPFLSYDWFKTLCNNLLKTNPEVMVFWDNNQPIGILPAMIENSTLKFLGDKRVTDYVDIICLPEHEHQIIEELASFVLAENLHIDLSPIETGSPLFKLSEITEGTITEQADLCPLLSLPESWEGYLNGLNAKSRHELRRKLRKTANVTVRKINPEKIDILFNLMTLSDINKKRFLEKEICSFFKAIAQAFYRNQWLRLRIAYLDSQPIAALFSFQINNRIYLYNSGFDPNLSILSPGIVTICKDIMAAIDEGFRYYDFLRGDEQYKFHLGAEKRYTMRIKR